MPGGEALLPGGELLVAGGTRLASSRCKFVVVVTSFARRMRGGSVIGAPLVDDGVSGTSLSSNCCREGAGCPAGGPSAGTCPSAGPDVDTGVGPDTSPGPGPGAGPGVGTGILKGIIRGGASFVPTSDEVSYNSHRERHNDTQVCACECVRECVLSCHAPRPLHTEPQGSRRHLNDQEPRKLSSSESSIELKCNKLTIRCLADDYLVRYTASC